MKINGKKIEGENVELCVIPRGDDEAIVFTAKAVLDMEGFDKLCKAPQPPTKIVKGGMKIEDVEDAGFKKRLDEYGLKRTQYIIIKSLEATEGLQWETVDLSDSSTWSNFESELRSSGFSEIEILRITNAVMTANCLNETKIEQAKKAFLLSRSLRENQISSQGDEQSIIQSGEPVNA